MQGFEVIPDQFNVYRICMYTYMNTDKYVQLGT
jgi:hypothetical protein